MEVEIIKHSDVFEIKEQWNELHAKDKNATFYNSYSFVSIWGKHKLENKQLKIILIKEGAFLLGLCVLLIRKTGWRYLNTTEVSFIDGVDFADILVDSTYKKPSSIVKKIVQEIDAVSEGRIHFSKITESSLLLWHYLKDIKYNKKCIVRSEAPFIDVNYWKIFQNYKKQCLPKNVNNFCNRLKKDFDYKFRVYKGKDIPFDSLQKIHISRTNAREGVNSSILVVKEDQYRELIKQDTSFCFCIEINDKIEAYQLVFVTKKTLHSWNIAHNPKFDNRSIGQVLYHDFFEYVFSEMNDIKMIDLGGGRYPWKFSLTPHSRLTYDIRINKKHTKFFNFMDNLEFGLRGFFKK